MRFVSVIQHTQSEFLGHIEDHLEGRGIRFGYSRPFTTGGSLPNSSTVGDGLILVGGGAWGTATRDKLLPSLDDEIRLTRACLMMGIPVLALGLGSQILAIAAEGKSEPAELTLTVGNARTIKDGALDSRLPQEFPNIVYGRDRPLPPDYADILAIDEQGLPAVFQIGPNAIGFTGHPGLRPAMLEDLVMEFDEVPPDTAERLPAISVLGPKIEDALIPIMTGVIELTGWMK